MHALAAHPEVFVPQKEIAYFEDPDYQQKSRAWFESKFDAAGERRAVGFKRPSLLGRPECPPRLAEFNPRLRLVVALRDPIERAVSAYFHLMKTGLFPVLEIERGMSAILEGSLEVQWPVSKTVIEWGLYHRHLQTYLRYFPREQLCVLLYDDLKTAREATLRRLFEFVGVDPQFVPANVPEKPMPGAYSMTRLRILRFLQPLQSALIADRSRVLRHRGWIGRSSGAVVQAVDRFVLARVFPAKRPELPPALHARLAERFRNDVSSLADFLQRDLSAWMRPR
jgi:hypothetical protein